MGGSQGSERAVWGLHLGSLSLLTVCRNRVRVHEGGSVQLCPHQMLKESRPDSKDAESPAD